MPSERRFRYDGAKATRFYQPNDGDDRMNENDEDVVHAGIVSNLEKPLNSADFVIRHRQALRQALPNKTDSPHSQLHSAV